MRDPPTTVVHDHNEEAVMGHHRCLLTHAISISVTALAAANAHAQASHERVVDASVPYEFVLDNPCTAEIVVYSGRLTSISQTTYADGGIHQALHFTFHGAGNGEITGAAYRLNNTFMQVYQDAGDPSQPGQTHLSAVQSLRQINRSELDAVYRFTVRITDNGNGERVLDATSEFLGCQ